MLKLKIPTHLDLFLVRHRQAPGTGYTASSEVLPDGSSAVFYSFQGAKTYITASNCADYEYARSSLHPWMSFAVEEVEAASPEAAPEYTTDLFSEIKGTLNLMHRILDVLSAGTHDVQYRYVPALMESKWKLFEPGNNLTAYRNALTDLLKEVFKGTAEVRFAKKEPKTLLVPDGCFWIKEKATEEKYLCVRKNAASCSFRTDAGELCSVHAGNYDKYEYSFFDDTRDTWCQFGVK